MTHLHISEDLSKSHNVLIRKESCLCINDRIMINTKDIWHKGLLKPEYKNRTLIGTIALFAKSGKIGIEFDEPIYSATEGQRSELYNKSFSVYHNLNDRARDFCCTYFDPERREFRVFNKPYKIIVREYKGF